MANAFAAGLEKARILDTSGGGVLLCRFNPKELTISKSATWHRTNTRGARSAPTPEFVGTNPRTLGMELFFDAWESASGDVSRDVDTLLDWTNPSRLSLGVQNPNPPLLAFQWGMKAYLTGYLKSVSAKYTLFREDGRPARASVTISLEEVPNDAGRQNPSSGGVAGRRTHVIAAGDTLQSIAHGEYGTPTLWRALAVANGIDDPLRVPPGTTVLIPPAREAAELA